MLLVALLVASGTGAVVVGQHIVNNPTADDLRLMSERSLRILRRTAPYLFFLFGAAAPFIFWPSVLIWRIRGRPSDALAQRRPR